MIRVIIGGDPVKNRAIIERANAYDITDGDTNAYANDLGDLWMKDDIFRRMIRDGSLDPVRDTLSPAGRMTAPKRRERRRRDQAS